MSKEKLKWTRTPYDTYEAEYKGFLIINSVGDYYPKGLNVLFNGDLMSVHTLEEAKKTIDECINFTE